MNVTDSFDRFAPSFHIAWKLEALTFYLSAVFQIIGDTVEKETIACSPSKKLRLESNRTS